MKTSRKLFKVFFLAIWLTSLNCEFPYQINVTNNYDENISVVFGLYSAPQSFGFPDTTVYEINKNETRTIRSESFYFTSVENDYELRLILTTSKSGDTLEFNRVTTGFLESYKFDITLPMSKNITKPDTTLFQELLVKEVGDQKYFNHYILAQYYYNSKNYQKCIEIIQNLELEKLQSKIRFNEKRELIDAVLEAELRGFYLLGFLASAKLRESTLSNQYWLLLKNTFLQYATFISRYDPEISQIYYKNVES